MHGTRDAAWTALYDALPPGWRIGLWTFDPFHGEVTVAAVGPRTTRRGTPNENFVVGHGADDLAAMRALTAALEARAH